MVTEIFTFNFTAGVDANPKVQGYVSAAMDGLYLAVGAIGTALGSRVLRGGGLLGGVVVNSTVGSLNVLLEDPYETNFDPSWITSFRLTRTSDGYVHVDIPNGTQTFTTGITAETEGVYYALGSTSINPNTVGLLNGNNTTIEIGITVPTTPSEWAMLKAVKHNWNVNPPSISQAWDIIFTDAGIPAGQFNERLMLWLEGEGFTQGGLTARVAAWKAVSLSQ